MNNTIQTLLSQVELPRFVKVQQSFHQSHIPSEQIHETVRRELSRPDICSKIQPGKRICLTCGSRGIDNIVEIIRTVVSFCRERSAIPFAIPAMGSHGGATAEGQLEVLTSLGITEASIGCPIYSSMETVLIGQTADGHPVQIDSFAAKSDGIILINRIKPHTSFRGPYESGLMKMMAIGLGKQKGAQICHENGFTQMHHMVPLFGKAILAQAPILFGLGILENAYDKTYSLHALTPQQIIDDEPKLLQQAAALMPSLGFKECDVLVVDEIGKNISGCGMDPNISGVFATPGITGGICAQRRCILSLTPQTHGNGYGMGAVDVVTRRLYEQLDLQTIYPNAITSTSLSFSKIPVIMESDANAIKLCLHTCTNINKDHPRIIRIRNTLELEEFEISESLAQQLPGNIRIIDGPYHLHFDANGNLLP